MSEEVKLPELPEPDGSSSVVVGSQRVGRFIADVTEEVDAWSRELVLEYARAAVLMERERCAGIAESDEFYGSANQHAIAAAIRGTKE